MTQEYTPVAWQDETTSQQGTLINAERLNQMQTAHHFADGFEEVDAVPTADPGVSYHKVVYCTADSTFYRWNGTQWTADIDDPTRELLEEHEADHDNPHQVTKAQVGLGNCNNTSDADKPISTATQTALDTKLTQRFTTAVGREYVYAYTRTQQTAIEANQGMETLTIPIRDSEGAMHAQVPASPQATHVINYGWANTELDKKADKATTYTKAETDTLLGGKADKATTLAGYGITDAYTKTEADTLLAGKASTTAVQTLDTRVGALETGLADTYNKSQVDTYLAAKANDDAVVHITRNESIAGTKTFTGTIIIDRATPLLTFKNEAIDVYETPETTQYSLIFMRDKNDVELSSFGIRKFSTGVQEWYIYQKNDDLVGQMGLTSDTVNSRIYTFIPTPGAGYPSASAVNIAYISQTGDSANNNLLHRSGNETKAGVLTLTAQANALATYSARYRALTAEEITAGTVWCEITSFPTAYQHMRLRVRRSYGDVDAETDFLVSVQTQTIGTCVMVETFNVSPALGFAAGDLAVGIDSNGTSHIFLKMIKTGETAAPVTVVSVLEYINPYTTTYKLTPPTLADMVPVAAPVASDYTAYKVVA